MTTSNQTVLPVVLCGIAVFATLRRIHLHLHKDEDEKDYISGLPDDVLISIISRLPTKPSVRTSILSKRWINLYKHVPDIAITCSDFHAPHPLDHDSNVVSSDVERFLMLRFDAGSKVRSFQLRCFLSMSYVSRLKQCIYSLGKLDVEELVLHFSHPKCGAIANAEYVSLCDILAEMQSLKYFELDSCSLQPNLKSQCNSLQTLHLTSVRIYPGALDCILSNCLSLCSLSMDRCPCPSKLSFKGLNLQLKSLIVKLCPSVVEMELYASNLTEFKFQTSRFIKFTFDHIPLLQSIHVDSTESSMISYVFGGLSRDVPHLQSLTLAPNEVVATRLRYLWTKRFDNLRRLEMGLSCKTGINMLELALFMQSCPVLQEFYLSLFDHKGIIRYDATYCKGVEEIVHLELKKVEIHGFKGIRNEMRFASFLLETAINLERMHIVMPRRERTIYDLMCSQLNEVPRHNKIESQLQSQTVSSATQVTVEEEDFL